MIMRRNLLRLMGAGLSGAAWPEVGAAASEFPKGAIIRTVLKDLPPEALTTGGVLFHEHMSVAYNRTERQLTLPPPSTADIRPVIADVKEAAKAGVSLIVDGGHPDMGDGTQI